MKSQVYRPVTIVAAISALGTGASPAAQRMVGVVPSDGLTALVKRFTPAPGTTILGVQFENNDPTTAFPEVALVRGPLGALREGVVVASAAGVREPTPGMVTVLWPEPVAVTDKVPYYVTIRMPSPGKSGPGAGTAVGADDVAEPNGSFLTCGAEQSLLPARVELAITLLLGAAKTPSEEGSWQTDPVSSQSAAVRTYLGAGTPNPANPSTAIEFGLAEAAEVTLSIYDVSGRQVRSLVHEALAAGVHERVWDGRDDRGMRVATGVYVVRLLAGAKALTQKLVIAK